jgi:hypothetical protein
VKKKIVTLLMEASSLSSLDVEQLKFPLQSLLQDVVSQTFHFSPHSGITIYHCQQLLEVDEVFFTVLLTQQKKRFLQTLDISVE